MNKQLLQQIADMIPTIPGGEWDFDHVWCGTQGCAIGHAIKRGLINLIPEEGLFGTYWYASDPNSAANQLGLSPLQFENLFETRPPLPKLPTREFVHNRLIHFIQTGEISDNVPS